MVTSEASWVARGGQPLSRTFGQMQCVLGQVQGIFGQKQRAKRLWSDTRRSDAKHLWSEAKCLWSDASIFGRKRCAFSHMQNIFGQMQNIFGHKKTRMVRGRVPLTRCGKVLADCYCCCQQIVVFLLLRFSTTAVKQPQTKTELKGRRSYTLLLAAAVPLLLALQSPLPLPQTVLTTLSQLYGATLSTHAATHNHKLHGDTPPCRAAAHKHHSAIPTPQQFFSAFTLIMLFELTILAALCMFRLFIAVHCCKFPPAASPAPCFMDSMRSASRHNEVGDKPPRNGSG